MPGPRTMHDIRTLRGIGSRVPTMSESATYLQMHRLASEKLRLEREDELWARKRERIARRLAEIEQELKRTSRGRAIRASKTRIESPTRAHQQVILDY